MKLGEYLKSNGIKRSDFARRIGISNGRVTQLCDEAGWPSREVADRIATETAGAVTADDFLPARDTAEARA